MSPNDSNMPVENSQTDLIQKNRELYVYLHMNEYNKLKDEQIKRIGFRDMNIVLVAFGSVISFAIGDESIRSYALLALPVVCFVIGWTYLVNDEKISAIGRYIRTGLEDKLQNSINTDDTDTDPLFGCEVVHRTDKLKKRRKFFQFLVDEIVFCFSGIVALIIFWHLTPEMSWPVQILFWVEAALLVSLGIWIYEYATIKK